MFPVDFTGDEVHDGYLPEFVPTGIGQIDRDYVGQLYNQTAYAHAFGLTSSPAPVPLAQTPGYRAYKSVDPNGTPAAAVNDIYLQLEQLAIGVQMAGPDLTPSTFQEGLFAYPGHSGGDGAWQFSGNQFTLPNDTREVCWSTTAVSPVDGKAGAYLGTSNQRWPLFHIPKGSPGCP